MVGAGLLIAYAVGHRHLRAEALVFAVAVAFAGVGSFLFHGFDSDFGQWAHDVSLIMVLAVMAGVGSGRAIGHPVHPGWSAAAAFVVGGTLLAFAPGATNALVLVLLVVIGGAEIVSRRSGRRPLFGFWLILIATIGVTALLLGRSDAPLCDPDSELQFHGLWHLLIPAIAMLWAERAFSESRPRVRRRVAQSCRRTRSPARGPAARS